MEINCNIEEFKNDIFEIAREFISSEEKNFAINVEAINEVNDFLVKVNITLNEEIYNFEEKTSKNEFKEFLQFDENRFFKHTIKLVVYKSLSNLFKKELPWGSLTGVRPTKLAYEFINNGNSYLKTEYLLNKFYGISKEKTQLLIEVIKNQIGIVKNDKIINFYVNIPFCPTRCSYCSFISVEFERCKKYIPQYLECLIYEIRKMKEYIKSKSYIVKTVYIGGGTPTTLDATQLKTLLQELQFGNVEFTVECGRPDTITKEKLQVLKDYNVTRISINPQTFCNKTLKLIGRNHTAEDILKAYEVALDYNFIINMDLIAGLPNESFRTFKKSLDTVVLLQPQNITVHTLALKNTSNMTLNNEKVENNNIEKMISYARKKLTENEYGAYYLYRQKNMLGFYENVGYAKPKTACKFNVDSMEEFNNVLAVGAGAVSKRVNSLTKKIERSPNVKDVKEYIERIDEMIQRKINLF